MGEFRKPRDRRLSEDFIDVDVGKCVLKGVRRNLQTESRFANRKVQVNCVLARNISVQKNACPGALYEFDPATERRPLAKAREHVELQFEGGGNYRKAVDQRITVEADHESNSNGAMRDINFDIAQNCRSRDAVRTAIERRWPEFSALPTGARQQCT